MSAQAAFLSCGLTALGLIFFVIGVTAARSGRSSLRWPSVDGKVLSSAVVFDPFSGREQARLRYEYTVGDKTYTGSRIGFSGSGLFTTTRSAAEAEAQQYSEGETVRVYYDPVDPARCVLLPGSGMQPMLPIGIGGLFFVLGLIAGILAIAY